ncbi:hypothetical protein BDV06DRAFT_196706 [Aspergillus oleicola]
MLSRRVCDSCHSRKVRCDRNDPCGNCLDQNSSCTRSRGMRRLPKRDLSQYRRRQDNIALAQPERRSTPISSASRQDQENHRSRQPYRAPPGDHGSNVQQMRDDDPSNMLQDQQLMLLGDQDMNMNLNLKISMNIAFDLQSWMSMVPLTESQMINRPRLNTSQDPTWTRRQVLESALSVAGRIIGSMEQQIEAVGEDGQRYIPSAEFLYWMLNDIGSDKFGAFISDYFRHIGKDDLKHMGLSILTNTASPTDSILYTVCVNSVAFKFLNATLGTGTADDNLAQRLGQSALLYRETAKVALRQIPLLIKPSFTLLQALLCGIFLHQGSGDTSACRELAKTACRVAMDIGLHPGAANMQDLTEAEYYCFTWCYMLDRNYAWKFGGPRILQLEPDAVISPAPPHVSISTLQLIYLELAKVQDAMIPFLNDLTRAGRENAFDPNHSVGTFLLSKMEDIRAEISQINIPSPKWKGLELPSEIATLDFAYHSTLTTLLHLRQISLGHVQNQTATPAVTYPNSARSGLQALTLCASPDRQKTVAYLNWTLLYYPITACIALFCNAIATSHAGDFAILSAVAQCLSKTGELSPRVAAMQGLLGEFVKLRKGCILGLLTGGDNLGHDHGSGIGTGAGLGGPFGYGNSNDADALGLLSSSSVIDSMTMSTTSGAHSAQDALVFPFSLSGLTGVGGGAGFALGQELGQQEFDGASAGTDREGAFPTVFEEFLEF